MSILKMKGNQTPSPWIMRFLHLVQKRRPVLDLACGAGRHARIFLVEGYKVIALDRDVTGLEDLAHTPDIEVIEADLEAEEWPLVNQKFSGIVVTNYLYRPLFPYLINALAPDGVLLYETFSMGNERYGRPTNSEFLLRPNELRKRLEGPLHILSFEQGQTGGDTPRVIQRICAVKPGGRLLENLQL